MAKPIVLYIFHRDLRLYDNKTLIDAAAYARQHKAALLPVFIFTPSQVTEKNPYKSNASIQFMIESLEHLAREIAAGGGALQFLRGENLEVVADLLEHSSIIAIFETADYTPFAKNRQSEMLTLANYHEIEYFAVHDTYLTTPGSVLNGTGKPYQKFTPFYEAAMKQQVSKPLQKPRTIPWFSGRIPNTIDPKSIYPPPRRLHVHGGRAAGLKLLKKVPAIDYTAVHDVPSKETTNLSAHHHYGTIGIRETYQAAAGKTDLQRQLYWRDFYGQICNFFEDLYGTDPYKFQAEGQPGYAEWKKDRATFNAWCEGRTGVPIVDASMQQLLQTGYMHNRSRLIVSNWLVKDKKIYWRWGERFFAQHLVDYDFAQNFGNWCWVASVLPFSQAPFRKLDAQTQANKFDKEHIYIDKWNPSTK